MSKGPTKWKKDTVDEVISQKSQHDSQAEWEGEAFEDGMSVDESNEVISDDEIFWDEELK
uniref:Uncharacterized protein n=1 Tax=Ditylenchus dipsaci TaxID=166011 RepID=A0A915EBG9_9BILA